VPIDFIYW